MSRPEPTLTRRSLMQASAALACGLSVSAEAAIPSRPNVILTLGDHGAEEGFRFATSAAASHSGRPVGRTCWRGGRSVSEPSAQGSLVAAFAAAGYATALVTAGGHSHVPGDPAKPRFIAVLDEVDLAAPSNAILIRLPSMRAPSGNGLVIHMPGGLARCGSSDVPMNPLDIAPTVCGLADVPGSPAFVGRDYSALVHRVTGRQSR